MYGFLCPVLIHCPTDQLLLAVKGKKRFAYKMRDMTNQTRDAVVTLHEVQRRSKEKRASACAIHFIETYKSIIYKDLLTTIPFVSCSNKTLSKSGVVSCGPILSIYLFLLRRP